MTSSPLKKLLYLIVVLSALLTSNGIAQSIWRYLQMVYFKSLKNRFKSKLIAVACLSFLTNIAYGDEDGQGFWTPGQYASGSALPPMPGFSVTTLYYNYKGTSNTTTQGVTSKISATAQDLMLQPSYAFETKILGATPSIGIGVGGGRSFTGVNELYGGQQVYSGNQTTKGSADLYPIVNLYWTDSDRNHMMAYITGNVPTGNYSQNNLANIGTGHGAIDGGGGYTYTNRQSLMEASAVLGVTNNFKNSATNYKSGIDSHLDWAVSKGITRELSLGVAGYFYYQLTADGGSGNTVGANKGRVFGIGPEIGYLFTPGSGRVPMTYLSVRAYKESMVQNRTAGTAVFVSLTLDWGKNAVHLFIPEKPTVQ